VPAAWHRTEQYANNCVEADDGRPKAGLRPMRGLKQDRSARVIMSGHAFVQNLRRGHYELAVEEPANRRVAFATRTVSGWAHEQCAENDQGSRTAPKGDTYAGWTRPRDHPGDQSLKSWES